MEWSKVGARIKGLRERFNMNQDQVCEKLNISRPLLSEMENGHRPPTVPHLIELGNLFGKPYTYFLEVSDAPADPSQETHLALLYRMSAELADPKADKQAPQALSQIIEDFDIRIREFQFVHDLTGTKLPTRWLELRKLAEGAGQSFRPSLEDNRIRYAKQLAMLVRMDLGYGEESPAKDLKNRLEDVLGIFTFLVGNQNIRFDGASFVLDEKHAFICLGVSRIPRMRFTLAHELAHIINHRAGASLDRTLYDRRTFQEYFSNAFAAEFLMPEKATRSWWLNTSADQNALDRALQMASHFGVTLDAMVVRLENLNLVPQGIRKDLKKYMRENAISVKKYAKEKSMAVSREEYWNPLPALYETMCVELYRREEISEGKLTELLFMDRLSARERAAEIMDQFAMDPSADPMDGWPGGRAERLE